MSLKSLLQLILLLMIILIIGGVYYIYFLSIPSSNLIKKENGLYQIDNKLSNQELTMNDGVLEEVKFSKNKTNKNEDKLSKSEILNSSEKKINEKSNQSKEIEYIATRENGDVFKILAKYGRTNLEDSKMLDLEDVSGTISSKDKSDFYISSDFAKYNYTNQDSKFYSNVKIKYDDKEITCDNFELSVDENIAIAYKNVIFKNSGSVMKAKTIIVNISTKDVKINSNDKIQVFKN
tara:strand:+ start:2015 stop:2719 length:705 start_codon:yes stop_codon:yes gene_type:complete